jgi:hypothetical protein
MNHFIALHVPQEIRHSAKFSFRLAKQDERKFMRNLIWSCAKRKPNRIPDKIASLRLKAERSDFSGMTAFLLFEG